MRRREASLVNFYGLPEPNGNPHDQRTNEFSAFAEDDIKVNSKLTVNIGLRWEYDGYPSENKGLFTDVWRSLATIDNTGSFYINNPVGSLAGFVVQSNYNPNIAACGDPLARTACGLTAPAGIFPGYPGGATGVVFNTNKTLVKGAPIDDFGPRIGVARSRWAQRRWCAAGYSHPLRSGVRQPAGEQQRRQHAVQRLRGSFVGHQRPVRADQSGGYKVEILGYRTPRTLQIIANGANAGATNIVDRRARATAMATTSDDQRLAGCRWLISYTLGLQCGSPQGLDSGRRVCGIAQHAPVRLGESGKHRVPGSGSTERADRSAECGDDHRFGSAGHAEDSCRSTIRATRTRRIKSRTTSRRTRRWRSCRTTRWAGSASSASAPAACPPPRRKGDFALQQLAGTAEAPVLARIPAPAGLLHVEQADYERELSRGGQWYFGSGQRSFRRLLQQRSA